MIERQIEEWLSETKRQKICEEFSSQGWKRRTEMLKSALDVATKKYHQKEYRDTIEIQNRLYNSFEFDLRKVKNLEGLQAKKIEVVV